MGTHRHTMEAFLRAVHTAEYVADGPHLHMTVKYIGDPQTYPAWPGARGDSCFLPESLRDPDLDGGPVGYEDIEWIAVHAMPWHRHPHPGYDARYRALLDAVQELALDGVEVTPLRIVVHPSRS